jgi:hypothetical protein
LLDGLGYRAFSLPVEPQLYLCLIHPCDKLLAASWPFCVIAISADFHAKVSSVAESLFITLAMRLLGTFILA